MTEVSCYGCKHDSTDICNECIRMAVKNNISDKYTYDNKPHVYPTLVSHTMLQKFDIGLHNTAEWIIPEDFTHGNPTCSNCGFESADHRHYCPNCGAKIVGFSY